MQPLRPTLWRTCRVLANESRLNLLRALFSCDESTVSALAVKTGISEAFASTQLRALSARGLVSSRPAGRWMFYSFEPNMAVEHSETIGNAIRESFAAGAKNESLIAAATAFTHPRRISIIKCLGEGEKTFPELLASTHISTMALYRHLQKLTARNMVERKNNRYRQTKPGDTLGKTLLAIAATCSP
ncbi:MAG: metalloregulator ArsR/SmtB family transcription factor [Verrucomicrobiota bacterium]